jgi:hypothetical protein
LNQSTASKDFQNEAAATMFYNTQQQNRPDFLTVFSSGIFSGPKDNSARTNQCVRRCHASRGQSPPFNFDKSLILLFDPI